MELVFLYCTKCGNKLNNEDKFCTKCGMSTNDNLENNTLNKTNKDNPDSKEEVEILNEWLKWGEMETAYSKTLVAKKQELYEKVLKKYGELSEETNFGSK